MPGLPTRRLFVGRHTSPVRRAPGRPSGAEGRGKAIPPAGRPCGAIIGLTSGLTATGGGIFLTPLLLFMGWTGERRAAGVSAAFNLANSVAGAAGQLSGSETLPGALPFWALAAGVGGWIGAEYGSRQVGGVGLRRLLAVVLVLAGVKLMVP
jgi:uncharacterized membrane protein YfcA